MADQEPTADRPSFQPRSGTDGLASRYVLWRLAEKTVVAANGCWEWTGARSRRGYAIVSIKYPEWDESSAALHRVAYSMCIAPIPDGMCVCHRCDNPPCINPDHLFLGTNDDNILDKMSKARQARGDAVRKRHDHLRGEVVVTAKLTAEQVMEIRRAVQGGEGESVVAERFGMSKSQVCSIIRGRSWAHLPVLSAGVPMRRACPKCKQLIPTNGVHFKRHLEKCQLAKE